MSLSKDQQRTPRGSSTKLLRELSRQDSATKPTAKGFSVGGRSAIMDIVSGDDEEVDLVVSGAHVIEAIYELSEEDTKLNKLRHMCHNMTSLPLSPTSP